MHVVGGEERRRARTGDPLTYPTAVLRPRSGLSSLALLAGTVAGILSLSATLPISPASAKRRSLAITSPAKSATVDAQVRLAVRASRAYKRVGFRLDGRRIWVDRRYPFGFRKTGYLDTSGLKRGKHRLRVAGRRRDGRLNRVWRVFRVRHRTPGPSAPPRAPAAPAPAPPPPPVPFRTGVCTAATNHTFQNSITQPPGLPGVQAVAGRITLSSDFAVPGTRSGRFELRAGDNVAEGNRAEIRSGSDQSFSEGQESWIRQSTLISDTGFTESGWRIVRQHHSSDGSPAIAVFLDLNPLQFRVGHGDSSRVDWRSPPISRNAWYDLTIHWRSASNGGGFVEVWFARLGQVPAVVARTNNLTTRETHSYYKTGAYRSSSISETDVVYHDDICMGSTQAQVGL
jgi:hypothetical protein